MTPKPKANGNGAGNGEGDVVEGDPQAVDPTPLIAELLAALQRMNAPKRIVRDEAGRPVGIEPVVNS